METVKSAQISNCKSVTPIKTLMTEFNNVTPPNSPKSKSLCFISTADQFLEALPFATGLIILEKIIPNLDLSLFKQDIWSTSNVHLAMSEVLHLFDQSNNYKCGPLNHINGSYISPSAKIGKNVKIAPLCVIEDNAIIEDNVELCSHVHIGHHAHIKSHTTIRPHVFIGAYCEIGRNCLISANTTIGSDGFGFYSDKQNTHHKIPQIGRVVIEDHVEVGSQCAFDRATLTETRIKSGSKFDNFCHIAHNCTIGENGLYTAGFIVAGSTQIGKNVVTAGGVHVTGHVKICDNVLLTGRAGVINNIEKPGAYGGFPHTDHRTNIKIMSSLESLPKIRKQIVSIMKHIGLDYKD